MAVRARAYLLLIISIPLLVSAQQLSEVQRLEEGGKFNEAASLLHQMLDNEELAPDVRKELEFELDRLDRIRLDYSLTEETLFSQLVRSVKDLTREEFVRWVKEGRFDRRMIDGEARFVGVSRSNLFFRYPDAVARR
ncbi:MAG: transglutaminase protein, partial [Bacteroidetes bacterium]|nr:transglutaminase protein [Bacteroidota bacterium]